MRLKHAILFHERVTKTRKNKGDIDCTVSPIPIKEWNKDGTPKVAYRFFIDKLDEIIDSVEEDISRHEDGLDDYDRGYDEGYLAGVNYAKALYKEDI